MTDREIAHLVELALAQGWTVEPDGGNLFFTKSGLTLFFPIRTAGGLEHLIARTLLEMAGLEYRTPPDRWRPSRRWALGWGAVLRRRR